MMTPKWAKAMTKAFLMLFIKLSFVFSKCDHTLNHSSNHIWGFYHNPLLRMPML